MPSQLAERVFVKESQHLADLCKKQTDLYNQAIWYLRQEYFNNDNEGEGFLSYYDLNDKNMLRWKQCYRDAIPGCAANTIRRACEAWKAYWKALKAWKNNPSSFTGKPKMPGYVQKGKPSPVYFTYGQFSIKDKCIFLPKAVGIGPMQFPRLQDQKIGDTAAPVKQVRVIPSIHRGYWIEAVYNVEVKEIERDESRIMSIDIGLKYIATAVDNCGGQPISFSGGPFKSLNQFYNKEMSRLRSEQCRTTPRIAEIQRKYHDGELSDEEWREWRSMSGMTSRMKQLTQKRNDRVSTMFHRLSREIINEAIKREIGVIVIGHNPGQKQRIDLGKKTNQQFTQLPIFKLIGQIAYKAELQCIKMIEVTEEYTSKASFLDGDVIPDRKKVRKKENGHSNVIFSGRRSPRGLYTSSAGIKIHADVNGAYNIMRKAFPDAARAADGIGGARLHPTIRWIAVS